jgi:hypothetical protein
MTRPASPTKCLLVVAEITSDGTYRMVLTASVLSVAP